MQNKNTWREVPDFLQCRINNEKERQAFTLAFTVCDMLKSHMESVEIKQIERRVNNLCQRAVNIAKVLIITWLLIILKMNFTILKQIQL